MRILVVASDTFPPFRPDVAVLVARELPRLGYHVDWLLQSADACAAPREVPWGVGRAWVGPTDSGEDLFHRLRKHALRRRHARSIDTLLGRSRYDAVILKDVFLEALPAMAACRRRGVPFVYWLSYPFPEASLQRVFDGTARYPLVYLARGLWFRALLYRRILPRARHVLVQSEQMRQDLAARGVPPPRMTPVPMGVDLAALDAAVGVVADPSDAPLIGYLGTLNRIRQLDFLVRVLVRVRARVPGARLCMVGGGDDPADEAALRRAADEQGVGDALELTGRLPQAEAWRRMVQACVCVSPFRPSPVLQSTSPTKLVEYMALRRAVVANEHPEQSAVLGESGGGLCVPYTEDAFAEALIRLLQDRAAARAMGDRGRRYVEARRDYPRIAGQLDACLRAWVPGEASARA